MEITDVLSLSCTNDKSAKVKKKSAKVESKEWEDQVSQREKQVGYEDSKELNC